MSTTGGAAILLYHRVARIERDVHGMAVDPEVFAEQIAAVRARADVVTLEELVEPSDHDRVAITFDDGYADNLEVALPVLRAAEAPVTVFVTTEGLDEGQHLWWDRVEHVVDGVGRRGSGFVDVRAGDRRLRVDVRTDDGRARGVKALSRLLRQLPPAQITDILDATDVDADHDAEPCTAHRRLTGAGVRELAADPLVTIGAHTRRHANLGRLDDKRQIEEIAGSRDDLTAITGRTPTTFAYPFGMAGSFDRTTERLVRDAGFTLACANVPGPLRRRERFRLPRHIVGSWSGDEVGRKLDDWLRPIR